MKWIVTNKDLNFELQIVTIYPNLIAKAENCGIKIEHNR